MLDKFRQAGLGAQVDSWVGNGANLSLSPEQLQKALGSEALVNVASQLGLSSGAAGTALAKLLPELINHLTPQGQVPDNHAELLSQALSALKSQTR